MLAYASNVAVKLIDLLLFSFMSVKLDFPSFFVSILKVNLNNVECNSAHLLSSLL